MKRDAWYIILFPLLVIALVSFGVLWLVGVWMAAKIANAFSINKQ